MDLILSVLADPQGANMLKHTKLFTQAGGSLGRADGNDWVLPDPERVVSSQHAQIAFSDNQYFLIDNSTNGTYVNRGENPLGKGNRVALNEGDIIGIGDYQLKVALRRPQGESGLPKGLGDADFLDGSDRTTFSAASAAKMQNQAEAQQLDSWLEPGATSGASHTGEWGYVGSAGQSSLAADSLGGGLGGGLGGDSVDPLAAFDSGNNFTPGADPLSGFGSGGTGGSQWADDDWWKDGSEQDHAPADRNAMHFRPEQPGPAPAQVAPSAPVAVPQPPVAPQPAAPSPAAPQPPAPEPAAPQPATPQPAANNPFAESFAAIQGQQVEGAPGFDSTPLSTGAPGPAAGFSAASQQFSQLQQTPPGAGLQQNPVQVPPPPPPPPPQAPAQTAATAGSGALAAALGLNLAPAQQQQLDQQAAAIVQETIARLIDLLRARTSIKNELRVQRTMIQTEANNPLKFSATAADALTAMFAGNGAFMDPQRAVADSFDDLSDHQVAVLAGMRAGYDAMLKFFNPANVERRLNSQGGVFASKNARNWEGFIDMYRELVADPDACYRRLFGDEFASTYEHQLSELKNARHLKN